MNRIAMAVIGGLTGVAAALLLGSRESRKRLADQVGETLKLGANARLRATPLIESGQEAAREVAKRARGLAADAAGLAQTMAERAQSAAPALRQARGRRAQGATDAAKLATDAARKTLDAVDELVRRTQDVVHEARKRLD
ncbi:MAG: hypothetical protein FJZ01_19020 [Candidatus Sericytochromatia bacterium]|nr:hypothetical protein [Candidatus Tanganyikabacteria bacterium]